MAGPITPQDAINAQSEAIPDYVYEAVNFFLVARSSDNKSDIIITQNELIDTILKLNPDVYRQTLFDNRYLEIEHAYRKAGWIVTYDKPAYCENYEASFTFKH